MEMDELRCCVVGRHVLRWRGILELVILHSCVGTFSVFPAHVLASVTLSVPDLRGRTEM